MGGGSKPGEVIEFRVVAKFGRHVVIEVDDKEQLEYLEKGIDYIGPITPSPKK